MRGTVQVGVVGLRIAAAAFVLAGVAQWVTLLWGPGWPYVVGGVGFLAVAVLLELMARRLRRLDRVPLLFDRRFHGPAVGVLFLLVAVAFSYSTLG